MSESLKDLTINIVAFLMTATAAIAIKYAVPELGDSYVQVVAGLVALLIVFLIWRFGWRPREEDLRVRRAHERALRSIAEEREFLTKQLESVKAELRELKRKIARQPDAVSTLAETIQAKRDEHRDILTHLSFLKGEPVKGPQEELVFPADAVRGLLDAAWQSIPAGVIGLPLVTLIWALVFEFIGGAMGISAGLLVALASYLLFIRFATPEYHLQLLKQTKTRLPFTVHVFLVVTPFALLLYFLIQLLSTMPQEFRTSFPDGVNWLGLWIAIILNGVAQAGLIITIPRARGFTDWIERILLGAASVLVIGVALFGVAVQGYLVVLIVVRGDISSLLHAWAELDAYCKAVRPGMIDQTLLALQLVSREIASASPQARVISAVILPLVVLLPSALSKLGKMLKARRKILAIEESVQLVSIYSPLSRTPSLRGLQLNGVNLAGWNLEGADLRESDLTGAVMTETKLCEAKLQGTILKGARLKKADLRHASLREADLEGADLTEAVLACADLSDADLRRARLRGAHLFRSKFAGTDVAGARVSGRHWIWPQSLPINPGQTIADDVPEAGGLNCDGKPLTWNEHEEITRTPGWRRFSRVLGCPEETRFTGRVYSHEPEGIILYAERTSGLTLLGDGERWRLCGLPLDSDDEGEQPKVLLENITDCRHIKVSKDRTTIAAVVWEDGRHAIYILRAKNDWEPTKIVEDCRRWLGSDLYLADDGTMIGTDFSECSVLLESEGWKRHAISGSSFSGNTGLYRISDNGRTVTQGRGTGIVVWDVWHDWKPYFVSVVPTKMTEDMRYSLGMEYNYEVGSESRIVLGAGYTRKQKYALVLANRVPGEYSQALIWESRGEIKVHAVAESNDCGIFSVDKELTSCSVYGIRRKTDWEPELILTAGRYVGWVVDKSLDGDFFVLAIQEQPYAIYAIRLRNDAWESYRLFSDVTSDVGDRPISAIVAPDRRHVAGMSISSDTRELVLRCVTPDGKPVGEWPLGEYLMTRGGRIEFSPDSQWLSYLVETVSDAGRRPRRMIRRIDSSEERELYSYAYYPTRDKVYIGWVISGTQSQPVA